MSVYVLTEVGWEYDDNYYYKTGGGLPRLVFSDLEIAKDHRMELERSRVRLFKNDYFDYLEGFRYGLDMAKHIIEKMSSGPQSDMLKELIKFKGEQISFLKDIKDYSDSELDFIIEFFEIKFYEVIEVEFAA
jgi:hypothetical protein